MNLSARNPWRRLELSARAGWLVVGVYGVAMAVIVTRAFYGQPEVSATRAVDEVVLLVCLLFAAGCMLRAARAATGRRRYGWIAMATALVGWAAGEVIVTVDELRTNFAQAPQPPSLADLVLIVYPVGACVSLLCLSEGRGRDRWRLVLDAGIVATSLFAISWIFVVGELLRRGGSSAPVTLAHIVADVVVITTAILVWSRAGADGRPSLSLVVGGIMSIGVADITIVYLTGVGGYHSGDIVDLARLAGLGMLALAALSSVNERPADTSPMEVHSRARLWLPYLPLVLAGGVGLGYALGQSGYRPLLAMAGVIVVLVLARQFVVLFENQRLLSHVAREAFHDSLTGLANRAHFLDRLERALVRRRRQGEPVAVLCLDLDNFKTVNDELGHPAGDELLIRVAGRLRSCVCETCTVARLGGDEFAVLIEDSVEELLATAHRVLDAFTSTIVIDGVSLTVRPSIGLTIATSEARCTVDELLRHADLAMYAAKRDGGGCMRSFVPELPFPYELPQLVDPVAGIANPLIRATPGSDPRLPAVKQDLTTEAVGSVRWAPPAIWAALAALALGVAVFAASTFAHVAGSEGFFAEVLYPALNLFAAGLIGLRAYRVRAERLAWILIAAGMASSGVGDVIYAAWVSDGQSPSAADPAYLASYPLVYAGLLLLVRGCLQRVPTTIRLDALVCGLTAAAVAAALASGPIGAATTRATATVLVGILYPWGDLLLVALAAGMLPILGWRNEFRWGLLVAGFMLSVVADVVYLFETAGSSYRVGTSLDAAWPAASLLVALASWLPSSSVSIRRGTGLSSYLAPVACTVAAIAVAVLANESRVAVALAALSLIAVAARFAVTFRDLSALAETHRHAMTDDLTGLPNRRALATALTAAPVTESSKAAWSRSRRVLLLLLDIDDFQEINDLVGRHVGDELLCRIAERLAKSVPNENLLARAGDDEFAVLLADGADLSTAKAQAGALLEAFQAPFALDQITVQVDASIAIAVCPDHCEHPQELLSRVETTLPHAKAAATKIAMYDSADELDHQNDSQLVDDLRSALSNGELTCYYQPKIDARDGRVHSVEGLLRWHHPTRGLLLPEAFLPAAERAGLMRQLANTVIDIALTQIRSWRRKGITLTVAVNLSPTNLLDLDLVDTIERLLATHGLPAEALIVEITESTLATDSVRSRSTVAALRRLGVRISLDDYGTGWSSLARLQDLSVDELKLDRVFVSRIAQDPRSMAIVRSTVALAHSLGADLVAEGVEDEATLGALRRYGCNITQGYVHSPPLPANEFEQWIAEYTPTVNYPHAVATD